MSRAPADDYRPQISAFRTLGSGTAVAIILAVSVAVIAFLAWLIYLKPSTGSSSNLVAQLPAVNATLNALSATFLIAGYRAVRRGAFARHVRFMFAALGSSALFFVSYVVYHNFHGDTPFTGQGPVRPVYFFVLISHIVLSVLVVPLILLSFYLGLAGKYATHRRVSRYTLPVWLYVSVTGVLIFVMLKVFSV